MKINTALASRPAQTAAARSMRLALADVRTELDDAADYAEHFAQAFFLKGSVTFAAAYASKELRNAQIDRELRARRGMVALGGRN